MVGERKGELESMDAGKEVNEKGRTWKRRTRRTK